MRKLFCFLILTAGFIISCNNFSDTTWTSVSGTSTLVISAPNWILRENSDDCFRGTVSIEKKEAEFYVEERFFDDSWVSLPEGVVWYGFFTSSTRLELKKVDEGATIVFRKS